MTTTREPLQPGRTPRDPVVDILGQNLRHLRKTAKLSAHDVARGTGQCSDQVVHAHERGDRQPNVSQLARYAAYYGVPAASLIRASEACRLCLGVPHAGFVCLECGAEGPAPFPPGGVR